MPHWKNGCGHKPDEFVGTTSYYDTSGIVRKIDVYVHSHHSCIDPPNVCIRHSNDPDAYSSCGPIHQFVELSGIGVPAYKAALLLLSATGKFSWSKTS